MRLGAHAFLLAVPLLVAGCGGTGTTVALLSAAGMPVTQTPGKETPLEIVTRSTGIPDPLPVEGSPVNFGDVETTLGHAISTAAVPWADAHRAQRPEGWQLFVELTRAEATYHGGRLVVTLGLRATLRTRSTRTYLAQTQANCRAGSRAPRGERGRGHLHLHGADGPRSLRLARPDRALIHRCLESGLLGAPISSLQSGGPHANAHRRPRPLHVCRLRSRGRARTPSAALQSSQQGPQHDVLGPGLLQSRIVRGLEDFDITYSTHKEVIHTTSAEGLTLDIHLACIYRPVVAELYELDTEIGTHLLRGGGGPELRSAARGVFARHSYQELAVKNEKIEDESRATCAAASTASTWRSRPSPWKPSSTRPEIAAADRAKLINEREASRQKAAIENDALKQKLALQLRPSRPRSTPRAPPRRPSSRPSAPAEQDKLEAERAVRSKQNERVIAEEDAKLAKAQAAATILHARAEAEQRILLAHATAEEKKAEAQAITWNEVQIHAYDALGKLGGDGTHFLIGDWARLPNFLFPRIGAGDGRLSHGPHELHATAQGEGAQQAHRAPRQSLRGMRRLLSLADAE